MVEKLANQQAVKNYIGKHTAFRFVCLVDGVAEYETVIPKWVGDELYVLRLSVFHESGQDLLDYETAEFLIGNYNVFELWTVDTLMNKECLFHRKHNEY